MTVNSSRSERRALLEGATDGKYRKARPDTELTPMTGDEATMHNREHLSPGYNYGYVNSEVPDALRAVPGTV